MVVEGAVDSDDVRQVRLAANLTFDLSPSTTFRTNRMIIQLSTHCLALTCDPTTCRRASLLVSVVTIVLGTGQGLIVNATCSGLDHACPCPCPVLSYQDMHVDTYGFAWLSRNSNSEFTQNKEWSGVERRGGRLLPTSRQARRENLDRPMISGHWRHSRDVGTLRRQSRTCMSPSFALVIGERMMHKSARAQHGRSGSHVDERRRRDHQTKSSQRRDYRHSTHARPIRSHSRRRIAGRCIQAARLIS